jgi:uncharacterized membrane protein
VGNNRSIAPHPRAFADLPRGIFSAWEPKRGRLLQQTIVLAFVSVLVFSFCVHDVKSGRGLLSIPLRISLFFAALFTTWLELHLGFALYYAKVFLVGNPVPSANGDEAQIFIFPGTDEPLFTDFLYVAYSVALTFAMSDVDLEDGFARGVVLVQAIVSYLFYSTIFSMVTTLMVS